MIYDFDSSWAYNAKGLLADMRACLHYAQYLEHTVYKTLYEAGEAVDFIFEWRSSRSTIWWLCRCISYTTRRWKRP